MPFATRGSKPYAPPDARSVEPSTTSVIEASGTLSRRQGLFGFGITFHLSHLMIIRRAALFLLLPAAAACGGGVAQDLAPMADTLVADMPFTDSVFEIRIEGNDGSRPGDVLLVGQTSRLIGRAVTAGRAQARGLVRAVAGARLRWRSLAPDVLAVDSVGRVRALRPGAGGVEAAAYLPGTGASAPAAVDTMPFRVVAAGAAAEGPRFTEISAAHSSDADQTCGITGQGAVACLLTLQGEAPDEGFEFPESRGAHPLPAPAGVRFHGVATGMGHVCALDAEGRAFCWGRNNWGQLGRPSLPAGRPAQPVATEARFTRLSAGREHTCGVTPDGAVLCWGLGLNGVLGRAAADRCTIEVEREPHRPVPEPVGCARTPRPVGLPGPAVDVAAGDDHTCALAADGALYCWGEVYSNGFRSRRPRRIRAGGARLARIASGSGHVCGLDAGGALFCWGRNWRGQTGTGDREGLRRLARVEGLPPLREVTVGAEHTCAIAAAGGALCWGWNWDAQLGGGGRRDPEPGKVRVAGEQEWLTLSAGTSHTCGVTIRGALYCWGSGLAFRTEPGSYHDQPEPFPVSGWR